MTRRIKLNLLIVMAAGLISLMPLEARAQYASLSGKIITRDRSEQGQVVEAPASNCLVFAQSRYRTLSARTDKDGSFIFSGLPTGVWKIVAIAEGYKKGITSVSVSAGRVNMVLLVLEREQAGSGTARGRR